MLCFVGGVKLFIDVRNCFYCVGGLIVVRCGYLGVWLWNQVSWCLV